MTEPRSNNGDTTGRRADAAEVVDTPGTSGAPEWSGERVRSTFLKFFEERGHRVMSSSGLVPAGDPTLLFTNAGMNQFKDVFLGHRERPAKCAATVQKCMRVSGKHNDLENVGPSTYHHTFFEMLGNFSFGDYFKKEAVEYAWELLTEVYGLPQERLWASVYEEDDEAWEIWKSGIGIDPDRLVRLGADENFWSMGDTGPCGPCSEVHYDYGEEFGCGEPDCGPACGCGRFVELWNLVFMQFNRSPDGEMEPLPSPNIDTGAGLERLTAVLQGVRSNYDTDLFQPVIRRAAGMAGTSYGSDERGDVALRVIADHLRALCFLLADGVMPSNEGRGYVLRRLVRRAMRFGRRLELTEPFLGALAEVVVERMSPAYPELEEAHELISRVIRKEEERFLDTLSAGTQVFEDIVAELRREGKETIPGEDAFRLYDTYGVPLELTAEMAAAEGLQIDQAGFDEAMQAQRQRARAAWRGAEDLLPRGLARRLRQEHGEEPTAFLGYDLREVEGAIVLALVRDADEVEELGAGESGGVIVDRTPFYAEAGGQVGDRGTMSGPGARLRVDDTQGPVPGIVLHRVTVEEGSVRPGDALDLQVDIDRRRRAMRNHTATHLVHAALRERLGEHVRQAGSLVAPDRLRFDFTHYAPLEDDDVEALEDAVNAAIRDDIGVEADIMPRREALERGALAFFGEKYGDRVRVVTVPGVSMELCGGTHVRRTGEIGAFLIQREESVAAGTRRLEAFTGDAAIELLQRYRDTVRRAASQLRTAEEQLPSQLERLQERLQEADRELGRLRLRLATREVSTDLSDSSVEVDGVTVVAREVPEIDAAGLRNLVDVLKQKIGSGVVVVGTRREGKAALVAGVTADVAERIAASDVIAALASVVGGGGGGHRELAQAGGPEGERLAEALKSAPEIVAELLSSARQR